MLKELQVKNFAIIDDETIVFKEGLNILTGETGAGKTLIIAAINLLIGERADNTMIRDGEDRLIVQGFFDFSKSKALIDLLIRQNILTEDDNYQDIVITREVNREGRNRAFVNGIFTRISILKTIGESLIDIHGQHDHQYLLRQSTHIKVLDEFGKKEIQDLRSDYDKKLKKYRQVAKELEGLNSIKFKKDEKLEEMQTQLDEIVKMNLKTGEEEELGSQKSKLKNYEEIHSLADECITLLGSQEDGGSSLIDKVAKIEKNIQILSKYDDIFKELSEEIKDFYISVKEIDNIIKDYYNDLEYDQEKLDQIQARIFNLSEIKRKYNMDIKELIEYGDKIKQKIENFKNIDRQVNEKTRQFEVTKDELANSANRLSDKRKEVALKLKQAVEKQMLDLNFKSVDFHVSFEARSQGNDVDEFRFDSDGIDVVEFLISLNTGEKPRPLKKIASGGEISRIMLALKTIIGVIDDISTLIFDEIDAGIGGLTSFIVGKKLYSISRNYQIICITHLPQIASFSDHHYKVEKDVTEERTKIDVMLLDEKEKAIEISRMLSGVDNSEIAYKHAEELLEETYKEKKELIKRGVGIGH